MLNRILPLLGINKIVPEDLLKKGLEKIEPKFKNLFSEAAKFGYPAGAVMGFLKSELGGAKDQPEDKSLRPDQAANLEIKNQNQFRQRLGETAGKIGAGAALGGIGGAALEGIGELMGSPPEPGNAPEPRGTPPTNPNPPGFQTFMDKHPELASYLDKLINSGITPREAALQAKKQRKLSPFIQDIEQNIGQNLEDLLDQLFQREQPKQSQKQNPTDKISRVIGLLQKQQMKQGQV